MIYVPEWFINAVDKLFTEFLWEGKPAKIKKKTIIANLIDGGLKMPHVETIVKALKLSWLRRLLQDKIEGRWKTLSWKILGNCTLNYINSKMEVKYIPVTNLPLFYSQVLDVWYYLYSVEPVEPEHILVETLWRNKFVCVDKLPITRGYENWEQSGIVYIHHLINLDTGRVLLPTEIENRYAITVDVMMYNSLISAIPRNWKTIIAMMVKPIICNTETEENTTIPSLILNGVLIKMTMFCNKQFVNMLLEKNHSLPTAINKWMIAHGDIDWPRVFLSPYCLVRDTKIQTFQYKVINRIIPCEYNLNLWKISDSNLCPVCAGLDTIEHFFYDCPMVRAFWSSLENWVAQITDTRVGVSKQEILLGLQTESNDQTLFIINYCILMGKWYIYTQRLRENTLFFIEYLQKLKNYINTEKFILYTEQKERVFERKWKVLYDALN
jgi:hypothetical protein